MLGPPPSEWTAVTWAFVVAGALYALGFVVFWVRFQAADRAAKRGDPGAPERFNAMLRGFPNTMYAKMMGKKPYEVQAGPGERGGPPR